MFFIPITALFVLKFTKYLAGKYRRVYRYRKLMVRNIEFLKMGFSLAQSIIMHLTGSIILEDVTCISTGALKMYQKRGICKNT